MAKNFLTRRDEYLVSVKLHEVCQRNSEGYAEYLPGWSDEAIVRHFKAAISNITLKHVHSLRREHFGNVRKVATPAHPTADPELLRRVRELEGVVRGLIEQPVVAPISTAGKELLKRLINTEVTVERLSQRLTTLEDAVTRPTPTNGATTNVSRY